MLLLIATDAAAPQIDGVVRSYERLTCELLRRQFLASIQLAISASEQAARSPDNSKREMEAVMGSNDADAIATWRSL